VEEDIQRKNDVDYINLSIINIMNDVIEERDEHGVLWYKKKLTEDQIKYHQKHMNNPTFKKYSPEMKIEGEYLYTKGFGQDLGNYHTDSKIYKNGIEYALNAIKELNDNGIYHGDIFSGSDGTFIHFKNIVYDGSEYRLIDFGPRTEKKTLEPIKKENVNKNIPKPTGMKAEAEDPVEWEKKLFERYKSTLSLRKNAEKQKEERKRNARRASEARKESMRNRSNKRFRRPPSLMDIDGSSDDEDMPFTPGRLFGKGGKKRRRRTKKKRKRKRKSTKKKRRRKRKSTKKKRRKRHR
jgi:hypothetical protein